MADDAPTPGFLPPTSLAASEPQTAEDVRALTVRLAEAVDGLNATLRSLRTTVGDETLELRARIRQLEGRLARVESPPVAPPPVAKPKAKTKAKTPASERKAQRRPE
jgi:hypothetical protein